MNTVVDTAVFVTAFVFVVYFPLFSLPPFFRPLPSLSPSRVSIAPRIDRPCPETEENLGSGPKNISFECIAKGCCEFTSVQWNRKTGKKGVTRVARNSACN